MTDPTSIPRTLTVAGHGRVSAPPDEAAVTLGVDVVRPTAAAARGAAADAMSAVVAAVRAVGVSAESMRTIDLAIGPETEYLPDGTMRRAGFRVSNRIAVRVSATHDVAGLVDAAVAAGATTLDGVQFGVADDGEARRAALAAAVDDARASAEAVARALGAGLGPVRSVREAPALDAPPRPHHATMEARAVETPVLPGPTDVRAFVEVTWDLVEPRDRPGVMPAVAVSRRSRPRASATTPRLRSGLAGE